MINDGISGSALLNGEEMRATRLTESGHVIFGPYVQLTHGVYQVDFSLALASDEEGGDEPCITLDVSSDYGNRLIESRVIRASDLTTEARSFSILFVLRQIHLIEYRVYAHGNAKILVGAQPAFKRISAVLDEGPRADLPQHLHNLEEFGRDTRRILRQLRPYDLVDFDKIRLGNPSDGGYVCVDDFNGIDTAFSFGINDDISWDLAAADRGLRVYQFDHTVSDPAPDDPRMIFQPKRIDRMSGPDSESLDNLIRKHDRGESRPNIILKMDIEGSEWQVFDATSSEALGRLAWIVCEMHYLQGLAESYHRQLIDSTLQKVGQAFGLVHVHANVWGGITSIANTVFPNVIEATFVNRSFYSLRDTHEIFPTVLDQSCDTEQPDMHLGCFRF